MTVQQHFSYPNAGGPQQQPHGHASRRTSTRRGPPGGGAQSVYARAYPATAGIAAGGGRLIAGAVPPHRQRMMATESARAAGGSPPAQRGSGGSSPRTPRGGGAAGRGRFVPSGPAAGDSSSPVGRQQSGAAGEMIDDMMLRCDARFRSRPAASSASSSSPSVCEAAGGTSYALPRSRVRPNQLVAVMSRSPPPPSRLSAPQSETVSGGFRPSC